MLLSKIEIHNRNLILGGQPQNYRSASYDVRVGLICDHAGIDDKRDCYILEPNGIVEVISEETVEVPDDICGFASIKTSLCDVGVLALNIGIIDPGWRGRLSTTLVNFGAQRHVIRKGDTFLRTTYQQILTPSPPPKFHEEDQAYIRKKEAKAVTYFNKTFVDVTKSAEAAFGTYKKYLSIWLPAFGVVASIFSGVTTYYATFLANSKSIDLTRDYWIPTSAKVEEQIKGNVAAVLAGDPSFLAAAKEFESTRSKLAVQEKRIQELSGKLDAVQTELERLRGMVKQ